MRKTIGAEDPHKSGGEGLWESILQEVAQEARAPDATLLLLGRPGIGKRTLVQALLTHACPAAAAAEAQAAADTALEGHSRAVALDYAYFGARDPELGEAAAAPDYACPAACSVLILEDVRHEKVLRSRLNLTAEGLRHCAAVICLDLKQPWTIIEDLRQWLELLQRVTADLLQQLPLAEQDELRTRLSEAMASYQEPGEMNGTATDNGGTPLAYNLGIPLIVVVTRSDGASALETQKTVGWSETIEAYLRSECLAYAATIIYTMVQAKNTQNLEILYDYLMHRLYAYPLKHKARVPSRDALFLPSGWDSQAKVDQAAAALPSGGLETSFESVVVSLEAPPAPTLPREECEDVQQFLKRSAHKLVGPSAASARAAAGVDGSAPSSALGAAASVKRASTLDPAAVSRVSGVVGARPSIAAPDGAAGGTTDNSTLASFFQNLLTRGQGGGSVSARPGQAPGTSAAAPPREPAASPAPAEGNAAVSPASPNGGDSGVAGGAVGGGAADASGAAS